ncbi:HEAT repeat domain-containing protein [Planctomicrobium piriforme]|uniref:HEAT repeat n=1 Tax=Planctomicrobium piriforme TaxID=1576369 RepID=A0A1I3PUD5_9PLAN|nr:HEAT repeat domain-containing protein [Planctomicrobium piriforme]SFJ25005.1 HEAT repeat [Planctomicrobium piriforme]
MQIPHFRTIVFCLAACLFAQGVQAEDDLSLKVERSAEAVRQEILAAAKLPGGDVVAGLADRPIPVWIERSFLGTNDAYSGEGFRYVVLRVAVANLTSADLELRREKIHLQSATQRVEVGPGKSREYRSVPLEIDWHPNRHPYPQSQLETLRKIKIPQGKSATFWCVFFGLNGIPVIPQMTLQLEFEGGSHADADVNVQQKARLGLTEQRLGPAGCLTAFTVHGQLNRINSEVLAQRILAASEKGSQRFLIEWSADAKPSDDVLFGWLLGTTSPDHDQNPLHLQLPILPSLRQLVLCRLPKDNADVSEWEEDRRNLFPGPTQAAVAALREVYERADTPTILREVRGGHPWSRYAALQVGGSRLGPEAYAPLMELAHGDDPEVRRLAILALGNQPQAEQYLVDLARGKDVDDAALALRGLLATTTPERQTLVNGLLADPQFAVPREQVLRLLMEAYHPAWNAYLIASVHAVEPTVRRTALQVLQQVGHPDLQRFCVAALNDPDATVREAAFLVLVDSEDPATQRAALGYALQQLSAGDVTDACLDLIEDLRESQAAPLLIAQLGNKDAPRLRMIEVIGHIGTDRHCQQVLDQMATLTPDEKVAALGLTIELSLETRLNAAREAAKSDESPVRDAAIEILKQIGNDEAVAILGGMLSTIEDDERTYLCMALGEIGSTQAVRQLRDYRAQAVKAKNFRAIRDVDEGLREWRNGLPGWNFVEAGNLHVVGEDLEEAVKAYSLAILINPELPDAYSSRGNVLLRRNEFKKAGDDFKRAHELDPYDSQAVTGIAIVQAIEGEWQSAVKFVNDQAEQFPQDRFYPYNTACVYARAVENLKKQPSTPELTEQIADLQKSAIEHLKKSIDFGFNQFDWMQKDPDLASIRDLPEFKQLVRNE